jgi:hypothetical protein
MKKRVFKALTGAAIVAVALVLANCGAKPSSEAPPRPVYSGNTAVGVTHSVNNYDDWLKVYKAKTDSNARISIYVAPDDPNKVTVFMLTTNHDDAKKMGASDAIKNDMKEAGVTSEPVMKYYDIKWRAQGISDKKYRVMVSHEVKDYDTWKKVFDADEPRRKESGLELRAISTDADNPKMVNIMFATDDVENTTAMLGSEDLKAKMAEAGVTSEPTVAVYMMPPSM